MRVRIIHHQPQATFFTVAAAVVVLFPLFPVPPPELKWDKRSIGTGKMMVEFFSAAIEPKVL